ncbi:hypothetical protein GCM10008014_35950 [Paenibacillus silvae]|uniref:AraC family transcriptional regulator n=1 Tax=Paenibacillus silvae TaxID=1325358 RepID=A0ABQ1ZGW5_9BACL|nr:AraC family transcriptional regulator [Paenibacillus silvae]GGH60959.1 hypothetical protein GCM10008014_35950 [Paenibacillus silvae]
MHSPLLHMTNTPWLFSLQAIQHIEFSSNTYAKYAWNADDIYSFIVVIQGKGVLEYKDDKTSIDPGSVYIAAGPEDVEFSVRADSGAELALKLYKIDMQNMADKYRRHPEPGENAWEQHDVVNPNVSANVDSDAGPTLSTASIPMVKTFAYVPWSACLEYIEQLYRQQFSSDCYEKWDVQIRFQQWFRDMVRQNDAGLEVHNDRLSLQETVHYIDAHYDQMITVDELASRAGLSRASYTRHFKRSTGQLPLDYVNRVRLERSKQLLQVTADRLHEIASRVGFSNEYYFSRRFKQYTGVSPGVYRRNHRQEVRVFAPYLEDFLLALGIKPIIQGSHRAWGRQRYLQLDDVPEFDVSQLDAGFHAEHTPEFIMLDMGYKTWNLDRLEQVAPVYYVNHDGEDWRTILKATADILGRTNRVQDVIETYEHKVSRARRHLHDRLRKETVAFLRVSASEITLYGDECGYVGPIIYQDLGLRPHPYVQKWTRGKRGVSIGLEQLNQLDADHLLITFDTRNSCDFGEERRLLDRQEWKQLPAVRRGNVYEVDFMSWMNYGVLSHNKKIDDILRFMG